MIQSSNQHNTQHMAIQNHSIYCESFKSGLIADADSLLDSFKNTSVKKSVFISLIFMDFLINDRILEMEIMHGIRQVISMVKCKTVSMVKCKCSISFAN